MKYLILIVKPGEVTALIAENWRVLDRAIERRNQIEKDNPTARVHLVAILE